MRRRDGCWRGIGAVAAGFAAGSVPVSNITAVRLTGTDLRTVGTGTASGSALYEVAGFGPLAVAGLAEVAAGALGPLLAARLAVPARPGTARPGPAGPGATGPAEPAPAGSAPAGSGATGPAEPAARPACSKPVIMTAAGAAAIAGHNFSPFLRGAGGRGLAPALGATLVLAPEATGVLLAGLAGGRVLRRTGLGCFLAYLAIPAVLFRTRSRAGLAQAAAIIAPLVLKRILGNEPAGARRARVCLRRLVFDHD